MAKAHNETKALTDTTEMFTVVSSDHINDNVV